MLGLGRGGQRRRGVEVDLGGGRRLMEEAEMVVGGLGSKAGRDGGFKLA